MFFFREKKSERKINRKLPFPKLVDFVDILGFFSRKKTDDYCRGRYGQLGKKTAVTHWVTAVFFLALPSVGNCCFFTKKK